jgi:hypothetical protein
MRIKNNINDIEPGQPGMVYITHNKLNYRLQ